MHEVPPLRHHSRETEVDIHHNLAPPVSRIRVDAAKLWADAVQVEGQYGLSVKVLAPVDMLLHNAIHLFMNDELRGGLRDVVDFRDLFRHFVSNSACCGGPRNSVAVAHCSMRSRRRSGWWVWYRRRRSVPTWKDLRRRRRCVI